MTPKSFTNRDNSYLLDILIASRNALTFTEGLSFDDFLESELHQNAVIRPQEIIGEAALRKNVKVMMSEVHGMAQRGGVVTCSVRLGDVTSPLIADGEADILLGFEPVETYRALNKGSDSTWIITNKDPMIPITVSAGDQTYPPPL